MGKIGMNDDIPGSDDNRVVPTRGNMKGIKKKIKSSKI